MPVVRSAAASHPLGFRQSTARLTPVVRSAAAGLPGRRACLGIVRLGRDDGHPGLEAAAGRVLEVGARG
ncbi:hypothetical protein L6V77_14645 [Myxococcota bacterium]|nr:hypothetical protein [Myxococcota bacterium]